MTGEFSITNAYVVAPVGMTLKGHPAPEQLVGWAGISPAVTSQFNFRFCPTQLPSALGCRSKSTSQETPACKDQNLVGFVSLGTQPTSVGTGCGLRMQTLKWDFGNLSSIGSGP